MTIEMLLRNAITMLKMCHVLGMDADKFEAAMKNIEACVNAIDTAKKEVKGNDYHDEQGQNV